MEDKNKVNDIPKIDLSPKSIKKYFDIREFISKNIPRFNFRISHFNKLIKRLGYYFKVWLLMSRNSFMIMLNQKKIIIFFLTGKILRFIFFLGFLYYLVVGTSNLAGYSVDQSIFFFLTFNVVNVIGQFLFREVYRFRTLVISGDLDLIMVKPINTLFRVLMGGADVMDFITIPPIIFAVWFVGSKFNPSFIHIFFYIILIINGLMITTAFYISILAFGILKMEIDHMVLIYRDIENLGRLPIDIYKQPLRGILTFLIPVGLMVTIPAKSLMGMVSPYWILISFSLGLIAIVISLRFWNYAMKYYTSASS